VVTEINPVLAMACGLLIAGGVHAVKSLAVRPAVTASTGGAANTPVSILEDITATALSIMAVIVPVLVASLMIIITAYIIWALWRRANRQHAAHS
jgi:hypothetical protein